MREFDRFVEIIARLRAPDGCPWDREQTHSTLVPYCIEEAYEVADAIHDGNMAELKNELGDLLLQIILHAQIASENNDFNIQDVVKDISEKMIRRHPHVFGDADIKTSEDVVNQWNDLKKKEGKKHVLEGVPRHAPQLHRSLQIGEKVASVGFDWESPQEVMEKVQEEFVEIENSKNKKEMEEELGDLLFSIVQWSRHQKINPEQALQKANEKFKKRFEAMEKMLEQDQKNPKNLSIDDWNGYWEKAKTMIRDSQ